MTDDDLHDTGGSAGKALLLMGLLVGLGLGIGAGYLSFGGGKPDSAMEEETAPEPMPTNLSTVPLERVAVPIYARRKERSVYIGNYFLNLTVEVSGSENQSRVQASLPRLRHAFIRAISQTDLMREDQPLELDLDKAADILKQAANETLGEGTVYSVLVSSALRVPN